MTLRKIQQAPILVTGVAGFIGFHTAIRLLERGERVIGLDNINDYYDVRLKKARLAKLKPFKEFTFTKTDLADRVKMRRLFATQSITRVVHLAAQAGVRYSLVNPHAYTDSNIEGFLNILEGCRQAKVEHLVYATCRFRFMTTLTIRSLSMQPAKRPMNLWPIAMRTSIESPALA
jgi:UDP-glucuronate 4-epimerase